MNTNTNLVEYAKRCLNNSCYIFGTYGQVVTPQLIELKRRQYPNQITATRAEKAKKNFIGRHCWDCSGIIKGFIMGSHYDPVQDRNARGMYNHCSKRGLIADIPRDVVGLLVFNKSLSHVGVYVGNGVVIEAKGFNYGIRKTNLSDFYYYGFYDEITYNDVPQSKTEIVPRGTISYKARVIAVSGLNFRSTPTVSNNKLGAYNYGDVVDILDELGEWSRTKDGYVNNKYIKRL